MKIKLTLNGHCIETEMKRMYDRLISQYFNAKSESEMKDLEYKLEIIQKGLENFDFKYLRSEYPELCGEKETNIYLSISNDKPYITLNDKIINGC